MENLVNFRKKILDDCLINLNSEILISSKGNFTNILEEKFKKILNVKYALFVNNGTAALHLALASLNIREGDEVLVPNFTFSATAHAVKHCGAKVILVPVSIPEGWINLDKVENYITNRTKAIIPVHINGYVGDMNRLYDLAKKYNLSIVEDSCQALGSIKDNVYAGTIGDVGCYSFQNSKQFSCGEGGLLVTNNEEIYNKSKLMMKFGDISENYLLYDTISAGYNYKATEMQAYILYQQIKYFDKLIKLRRDKYLELVELLKKYNISPIYTLNKENPWRMVFSINSIKDIPKELLDSLNSGRWCRKPLSKQLYFKSNVEQEDELEEYLKSLVWISLI